MIRSARTAQPVRNAMTDRVASLLRAQIMDLELKPEAPLQIHGLSKEFDVSPTPVREALNRLSAEGLVTVEPYRGFRVSELLSYDDLAQLLRAREVLECAAAKQAVTTGTRDTLSALRRVVDTMDELARAENLDVKAFNAADAEFHRRIVETSGNRFLVHAFDSLHAHVQIARHFQGRPPMEARRSNEEHRRILDAITRGDDTEVTEHVTSHIDGVLTRLRSDLETDQDAGVR
ncbi:GntR family transcriptional regulator [Spiractinospora alimapuensis]|uniref:GntR family transcriptional regulator n=1 Tax=Spiractinospora alimapuensis TaxID=2820884 RepID=UPI001F1E65ED|nr:GntR family transcriptional regulator [Spiractinospora alimapuensis]QVQ53512.1 GntR family transcriptional regulator [Spiractinospora alimapuensis]